MAQTLSQIMAELNKSGGYASDRAILNSQLKALPGQAAAEISGLDAKLATANDNIIQGARARGLGFSGIPLAEQAQYAATEYAPAVARVRQSQNEQRLGILGSLNSIDRDLRSQAQSIYENNRNFAENRRQFNLNHALAKQQAAASAGGGGGSAGDYLSALLGGGGGGGGASAGAARMVRRKDGGFNFTDASGRAISAAKYSQLKGIPFRTLLSQMAKSGDRGAQVGLQLFGNDYGFNRAKLAKGFDTKTFSYGPNSAKARSIIKALAW